MTEKGAGLRSLGMTEKRAAGGPAARCEHTATLGAPLELDPDVQLQAARLDPGVGHEVVAL
jgi:hypothetical protein